MSFVKKPCKNCPYRNDVRPFLTNERAEQLAYLATNQYNDFKCHKTTEYDEDSEEMVEARSSLTCAGFLTLMQNEIGKSRPGFEPSYEICYESTLDMIDAYEHENNNL